MIDIKVEMSGDEARVKVSGEAVILYGEELKKALLDATGACARVIVDTGDVVDLDLTCLQILCSAHRSALERKGSLEVRSGGQCSFEQAVDDLGYSREAGCSLDCDNTCLFTGGSHG